MNIALLPFDTKGFDSVLAWIMLAGVAAALGGVIYLLCRHYHHCRKHGKHHHRHQH